MNSELIMTLIAYMDIPCALHLLSKFLSEKYDASFHFLHFYSIILNS